MKSLMRRGLAFLLAISMAVPLGNVCSLTAFAEETTKQETTISENDQTKENSVTTNETETQNETEAVSETEAVNETETMKETASVSESAAFSEAAVESESESAQEKLTELSIEDDFHNQYGAVLYQDQKLSAESDGVTFTYDKKSDAVVISGKKAALTNNKILIDKEYDFSDSVIGRFSIDMTAPKRTVIVIGFYLDEDTEPFYTTKLVKQKKDDTWVYAKDVTTDVYDLKITGKHKISFALQDNEETPSKVSFSFKSFEFVKSTVPVVYFDLDEEDGTIAAMNTDTTHTTECYGDMYIRVPDDYQSEYDEVTPGKYQYTLDYIRGRGNSTWYADKKPYKLKLEKKKNLLGMGEQKHWVLLANYYDNSLLRNKLTYWLGEQINQEIQNAYAFTPASVAVDVVMNGEYLGSYYLCEQIRLGTNRVDLTDLEDTPNETAADKITGGYLLSLSSVNEEDDKQYFSTSQDQSFYIESPSFEDIEVNDAQVDYIKNYVQKVEDAIYGTDFKNADGTYYGDLMDLTSTAYYYLMQEFSMNGDGFLSGSTYLYKEPDTTDDQGNTVKGKLYWGPLWDFDYVAWGSTEYSELCTTDWTQTDRVWFSKLFEDPNFNEIVLKAWPVLKEKLEALIEDGGQLDQYYEGLKDSAGYNFEHLGFTVLESKYNEDTEEETPYTLTYSEEEERLKAWIKKRIEWVDANIDQLAPGTCTVTFQLGSGTSPIVKEECQSRVISEFPSVPEKKNYTFTGWTISYHLTYEQYLKFFGWTEENLVKEEGKDFVNKLKKEGYDITNENFDTSQILPDVSKVTIKPVYVKTSSIHFPTKLYLGRTSYVMSLEDGAFDIPLGYYPFDAEVTGLTWTSSKPSIATVDSYGCVSPVSSGTTTITVTCGTLKASCKVKVLDYDDYEKMDYDVYPNNYQLNCNSCTMNLGSYKHFYVNYEPSECINTNSEIFLSSDESVVEVGSAGLVRAVGTGTCMIMTEVNDTILTCRVTVKDPDSIKIGNTFTYKGLKYQVTSVKNKTVEVTGASKSSVTKISVPSKVKYKNKTFKVTYIKSKAFYQYKKLKYVTLGSNVLKIGKKAFCGCKKLYSVSLSKNLTYIGTYAFANCSKLRKVCIKAKSPRMFKSTFKGIKSAAKIYVPKKWTGYYKVFIKKAHIIGKY